MAVRTAGGHAGSSRQLGEAVADAIVDAVAQGALEPGQRIVEADLAAQFDVSRIPIREAIKTLQAQGILQVTPNRGARVIGFEERIIDEVFEARVALEQIAARGAVEAYRRDPRRLDALREIISRMQRVARWSDWAELRKCDLAFHHEICKASGNSIVLKLWEALARHITIIFGRELASERDFDLVIRQHETLLAQLEAGTAGIEQVMADHILRLREARQRQPVARKPERSARR